MFELAENLTARVGGRVQVEAPRDPLEFAARILELREAGQNFRILGGGSNVIACDSLPRQTILMTTQMNRVERRCRRRWTVEAGANLTSLGHQSSREGLSGLECCVGIPGTIGAAIRINAGGKYGTVQGVVKEVTILTEGGHVERKETCAADFGYRTSGFFNTVILSAELEFAESAVDRCRSVVKEVLKHKRTTQPLRYPSAGCIFRNPPGDSAGRLIDAAGLKGECVGGAMVSELHANYIVNVHQATSEDFLQLIDLVRQRVYEYSGAELELEVDVWR